MKLKEAFVKITLPIALSLIALAILLKFPQTIGEAGIYIYFIVALLLPIGILSIIREIVKDKMKIKSIFEYIFFFSLFVSSALLTIAIGFVEYSSLSTFLSRMGWVFIFYGMGLISGWMRYIDGILTKPHTEDSKKNLLDMKQLKKVKNRIINERVYWTISILVVIVLAVVFYFLALSETDIILRNIYTGLVASLICALTTVILFTILYNRREKIVWNKVKNEIINNLKYEIMHLFYNIKLLIENEEYAILLPEDGEETEKKFIEQDYKVLEELAKKDKIEISERYKEHLKKGDFGRLFIHNKEYLSEIESKYFKHLNPDTIISIMKIQKQLNSIDIDINIKKGNKFPVPDEKFFEILSWRLHIIIKEIYKIYKRGLDFLN